MESECKSKLGAASENVCSFNHSGNPCDKSTTPTAATSNSTEIPFNATSTLNVTATPTQTLSSGGSFASTSVSGRSTSGHTEKIIIVVSIVLSSMVLVAFCVMIVRRRRSNRLHEVNSLSNVERGQSEARENIRLMEVSNTGNDNSNNHFMIILR